MVARPVQLRPGARTPTQLLEGTITMGTLAERGRAVVERLAPTRPPYGEQP